ncbi:MAG: hypothetical protein HPY87_08855 [Fervidobacterium sp.]|uniref:hypothetical protein n=1 Tax=Fervidobacterium sp. TaxID=1871331 RepID=UPI0025BC030D|nr:hypothetical protein [Fervidobacterium sp.]NPU89969.1 hypothetical protein [Fervidobacterium sp.]
MPTYEQIYDTWVSTRLKKQIVVALLKTCYDISNESQDTPNHEKRLRFVEKALNDPHMMALKMSNSVIVNPVVQQGNPTDDDIQFIINSNIDRYAIE